MNKRESTGLLYAMELADFIAKKYCDGHFTFLAFTTNYRCSFTGCQKDPNKMPLGKTPIEAVFAAYIELFKDLSATNKGEAIDELEMFKNVLCNRD